MPKPSDLSKDVRTELIEKGEDPRMESRKGGGQYKGRVK